MTFPNQIKSSQQLSIMKLAKINNRILFPSPTVQAGWQNQSFRTDFEHIKTLGKGAFGLVWQARHKKTGSIYAIKEIKKKAINNAMLMDHVKTQVRIMYLLNHPHIVKLYNHFQDDFSIYFVLQYAQKGQLYKFMMNQTPNKRFSEAQSSCYIKQVVLALHYIHQLNIIHRDIKPENLLINKEGNLKLADFGWSNFVQEIHSKRQTYCGTLDYLAPQMVQQSHKHDYRVDIWSVGVLIYELINGFSPFSYELLKSNNMSEAKVKQNIAKVNFKFPSEMSEDSKNLVAKILIKQPQKRISLGEILNHCWIKKYEKVQVEQEQMHKQWYAKVKNEFSQINRVFQPEAKKFQTFTEQQIYSCTRIEGIINKKINQGLQRQNQKDKRISELELKVKQFQLQMKIRDEEAKELKLNNEKLMKHVSKDSHQQCRQKSERLMQTIREQSQQIKNMHIKILQNERKLRQYAQN